MEDLRSLFGDEALTYEQLSEKLNSDEVKNSLQLVNLKKGGYVSKDKFDAIKGYKTKYETLNSQHEEVKSKYDNLVQEVEKKEKLSKVTEKVDKQYADFVYYKAENLVDDKTDFDKALDKFLKDNPQYVLEQKKSNSIKLSTGFNGKGKGNDGGSNTSSTMNSILLKALGRK